MIDNITRQVWAEIDLSAIKHNVEQAKQAVGDGVRVMAVVKANGYGHGAERVARAAVEAGAEFLGVAIAEEGDALRAAGVAQPILLLAEPPLSAIPLVVERDLSTAVCSLRTARALSDAAILRGKRIKVHVKVDTGMNRIGLTPEGVKAFVGEISMLPGIYIEGIFTHFAEADNVKSEYTERQLDVFRTLTKELKASGECPPIRHAANSAGTYLYPGSHFDMVRIGISLYGLHPSEGTRGRVDLRPALALKGKLSFTKQVEAGAGISYNRTHVTSNETVIGTVPIGYGDGYPRLLSNKIGVLVGGLRCPGVGNICMDQFMVDLGPESTAMRGDEVVLIGKQGDEEITVDELAESLGTINYEVVCMINGRVPRVYKN